MANVNFRRKALFHAPVPGNGSTDRSMGDSMLSLSARIHFEQEVESGQAGFQKGLHDQRLKKLRKKLDALAQDDWKYPTVESLIGLK